MKRKIVVMMVCFCMLYPRYNILAEEEEVVSITVNTEEWKGIEKGTKGKIDVATNYVYKNGEEYKIEMYVVQEEDRVTLNAHNTITNMSTNEMITYTEQNSATPATVSYLMHGEEQFTDIFYTEKTEVYYKIEEKNGKEILKKMYVNTEKDLDICVISEVTLEGAITHTVEITNISNVAFSNVSFMMHIDMLVNGNTNMTAFGNENNGSYIQSGHVHIFTTPIMNIERTYIGEKGIANKSELEEQTFLVTDDTIGISAPDFQSIAMYFVTGEQFIAPNESVSFSYEEIGDVGELQNKVVIKYLDEKNNVLGEVKVLEGEFGDPYATHKIDFEGYKLTDIEGEQKGTFMEEEQSVIYRYQNTNTVETRDTNQGMTYLVMLLISALGIGWYQKKKLYKK